MQRDLHVCWFSLHSVFSGHHHFVSVRDVLQRIEACALIRGDCLLNYCRAPWAFGLSSGDALIGFCQCASPLDQDIRRTHCGQPFAELWSLVCCCFFLFDDVHIWLFWRGLVQTSPGSQGNNGGLDAEILFWSFAYCLQSGRVPGPNPGVHLLEHNKYQVSAKQSAQTTGPHTDSTLPRVETLSCQIPLITVTLGFLFRSYFTSVNVTNIIVLPYTTRENKVLLSDCVYVSQYRADVV